MLHFHILAFLTFSLHTDSALGGEIKKRYFKPSQLISFENAKTEIKEIYSLGGQRETFHCGCVFDELLQVSSNICSQKPEKTESKSSRKEFVKWVHAMPLQVIGKRLKCRTENTCDSSMAQRCCNQVSPKFKIIQADMHNIFPSIHTKKTFHNSEFEDRGSGGFNGFFGGMEEYKLCKEDRQEFPLEHIQGDLARAYFYTSIQYRIPIPAELEDRLRAWHYQDPPSAWEEKRNTLIENVQGNRNPFIDHPELAERVKDF